MLDFDQIAELEVEFNAESGPETIVFSSARSAAIRPASRRTDDPTVGHQPSTYGAQTRRTPSGKETVGVHPVASRSFVTSNRCW